MGCERVSSSLPHCALFPLSRAYGSGADARPVLESSRIVGEKGPLAPTSTPLELTVGYVREDGTLVAVAEGEVS